MYIHTADSGNGITHGAMAGLILGDLIAGRDNAWAKLYSPTRKPIKAAGTYIKHAMEMGTRYRRWLKGGDVKDIEDIQAVHGGGGAEEGQVRRLLQGRGWAGGGHDGGVSASASHHKSGTTARRSPHSATSASHLHTLDHCHRHRLAHSPCRRMR